tara:strand:+ start:1453 stop:1788 length:336 start_codon:yes stop_codon:yes gene_type:complete
MPRAGSLLITRGDKSDNVPNASSITSSRSMKNALRRRSMNQKCCSNINTINYLLSATTAAELAVEAASAAASAAEAAAAAATTATASAEAATLSATSSGTSSGVAVSALSS